MELFTMIIKYKKMKLLYFINLCKLWKKLEFIVLTYMVNEDSLVTFLKAKYFSAINLYRIPFIFSDSHTT